MKPPVLAAAFIAMAATPAAAHEFIAHFDYGRAELSPRGFQLAREVVAFARSQRGTLSEITIRAHMDTAEAVEFSDELSRHRAQSLATELVNLGLSADVIEIQGMGAAHLARPTPPDTDEPLNRRVIVAVEFAR